MVKRDVSGMAGRMCLVLLIAVTCSAWAADVPGSFADKNGLEPAFYGNTEVEMCVARAAWMPEDSFTLSTTEYGPVAIKGVDGTPYAEFVLQGVFTMVEADKTPDPRAGFFRKLFAARPDVNAATAANPPAIGAYLISHAPFNPRVIPESFIQLRETPCFAFEAALNDGELVRTLSQRFPVVLVQNDAALTCGRTPVEAFDRLEVTEYSAQAAIMARSFGGLRPITNSPVEDLVTAFSLPRE